MTHRAENDATVHPCAGCGNVIPIDVTWCGGCGGPSAENDAALLVDSMRRGDRSREVRIARAVNREWPDVTPNPYRPTPPGGSDA